MAMKGKRWYRSRKSQILIAVGVVLITAYSVIHTRYYRGLDLDLTRRDSILQYIERELEEALKEDKGTGCDIPKLDPFSPEIMKFDKKTPKIKCFGQDWVKCYISECRVVPEILKTTSNVVCTYYDIVYENDRSYFVSKFGDKVAGDGVYVLKESDHVKIKCTGRYKKNILPTKWYGIATGFRVTATPKPSIPGREDSINVLIFGFDSTARNGFIRKMPHSYKFLKKELKATFLTSYNVLGDGTPASLFPILTGSTELELPEARKSISTDKWMDHTNFIFHKLRRDGYRTAYFEDTPSIGTFQYRFNGFKERPADHYLRDFYLEVDKHRKGNHREGFCLGDTPQYKLMMNITEQFFKLDGKKYCFTFVADITHNEFNEIESADDDFVEFLQKFRKDGHLRNTLLFVMGDHGPRYSNVRNTYQGKLEERLPLMAIVLPEQLINQRPEIESTLQMNMDVLTTPHDIYATSLDAMGLRKHWNMYKVKGADLYRGMTLLEPIPRNRSCSEAAIEAHWCACHRWVPLDPSDPLYRQAAERLVDHINELTKPVRAQCVFRDLESIAYVESRAARSGLMSFQGARDSDGYVGKFSGDEALPAVTYQLQVDISPGKGSYEASMTYIKKQKKFIINTRDISRINAYGKQPDCISAVYPHLNKFCYCRNYKGD